VPLNANLQADLQDLLRADYTLTRELPRGGMSRVFVATETALGRQVVIKVLAPELAATLSAERFRREIALAARLQHPHIVPLLASGQAGPHLYYTMPLVDGESLRDRINRERPMPIPTVVRILEEVVRALAYAHGEGIVHRDIKPENVMFFRGQAVVLDFGIGKALQKSTLDGPEAMRITLQGTSLGSPTYVAPEQSLGDASLDHRADLYALGVVAYEMLTGHPPFANRNPQLVMQAHRTQPPPPILERRADAPAHLVELVLRCLAKDPKERPASGEEIARLLDPSATPARGVRAAVQRVPYWVPWAVAGVSLLVALVLGTALILSR
jgi:serine/threonine protein kinase